MPLSNVNKAIIVTLIATIAETIATQANFESEMLESEAILLNLRNEIIRAPKTLRPKTDGFWTNIYPNLNDDSLTNGFKSHFRITKTTFHRLLNTISNHPVYQSNPFKPQTPIEMQVAIVLQRFANPMSYRELETSFGISQGSVENFTKRFCIAVLKNLQYAIKWPTDQSMQEVVEGFAPPEFRNPIPNVIGAIDGSHIPIQRPQVEYHQRYINRKGCYSVVLMAIVDHMEKFTYVYTGQPGDSAFPLMPWLFVPFKERVTQRLTRPQRQYNKVHSSARMAVERAFGKLKGRWRILKNPMEVTDLTTMVDIIDVCCILHNLCIDCDDLWEDVNLISDANNEIIDVNLGAHVATLRNAEIKRNQIVRQLFDE
ncbi:4179_t:CDS:2 [Paraglomus occultum]|uniref:4179_t:CDS:1 n=1 Tax=Paraglomus occultum TaxID=144539 RepID=A0A9N9G4C3_9GLOM|nr:4179_t:CDS:2 [Paraglomus occultum]